MENTDCFDIKKKVSEGPLADRDYGGGCRYL